MTDAIIKPKKDDPKKPQPDPTIPDGEDVPVGPMDWVGTGSVPEGKPEDGEKN